MVMFQPTLHFAKHWSGEESKMWRRLRPGNGEEMSHRAAALYAAAIPELDQWARAGQTRVLDLTRVFENTAETVYSDSVHFAGERGYAMLSAEIARQGLLGEITQKYRAWERQRQPAEEPTWAPQL